MKGTCLCGAIEVAAPQHNEVSFVIVICAESGQVVLYMRCIADLE